MDQYGVFRIFFTVGDVPIMDVQEQHIWVCVCISGWIFEFVWGIRNCGSSTRCITWDTSFIRQRNAFFIIGLFVFTRNVFFVYIYIMGKVSTAAYHIAKYTNEFECCFPSRQKCCLHKQYYVPMVEYGITVLQNIHQ